MPRKVDKKERMLSLIQKRMQAIGMYSGRQFAQQLYHVWTSGKVLVYREGSGKLIALDPAMKSSDMIDVIYYDAPKP